MEHLKPRFHVRPEQGWVNDPNGPVEHDGTLHLFFQSRPRLSLDTPVEWGHASSTDGVDWVVHASAIEPTVHPLASEGVYSGNTVSTPEGIRAFFSAFRHDRPFQTVLTALSTDDGATFHDAQIAVDDPTEAEGVAIYRDPFVWHDGDIWHLVVGAGRADGTAVTRHRTSVDGLTWTAAADLVQAPAPDTGPWGYMWECPQVLDDNGWTAVLVSVMDHEIAGFGPVLALTSRGESAPLAIEAVSAVDQGPDFYAASVLRRDGGGADGRAGGGDVVWGWVREARPDDWWTSDGWAGMVSLPREVRIDDDGALRSQPLEALTALRIDEGRAATGPLAVGAQFEFSMPVDPATGRQEVVLRFGESEELRIVVDHDSGSVAIDRSSASLDHRADATPITATGLGASGLEGGGAVRGFVDGSVVELFLPDGAPVTCRFYPVSPPPWQIEGIGADLHVWALRPAVGTHG